MHSVLAVAVPAVPAGLASAGLIATAAGWAVLTVVLYAYRKSIYALAVWLANKMDAVGISVLGRAVKPLAPISGAVRSVAGGIDTGLASAQLACEQASVWLAVQAWTLIKWQAREIADVADAAATAIWAHKMDIINIAFAPFVLEIKAAIKAIRKSVAVAHDLTETLYGRAHRGIDAVNKKVNTAIPKALKGIRTRLGTLERTIASPKWWTKNWARVFTPAIAASIVAVGLKGLGLRWLRCSNTRKLGSALCTAPVGLIGFLLSTATLTFTLQNLCALISGMQRLAEAVEPLLLAFVNEIEGFVCGGKENAATALVASDWNRVVRLPTGLVPSDVSS